MLYGIQITKSVILNKIAAKCHTPHASVVAFNADGEEKDSTIHYGAMPVRLPENPDFPDYALEQTDWRLELVDPEILQDVSSVRTFDGLIVRVMDDATDDVRRKCWPSR